MGSARPYVVPTTYLYQVNFTGNKWQKKLYRWHTGYPGGLKERPAVQMLQKNPTAILRKAILGMLKRNKLRMGCMERRLKVYVGPGHPHAAQLPEAVPAWPQVPPSKNGTFHFGLGQGPYAAPHSYQRGV
jgi:ribosomal protein L13